MRGLAARAMALACSQAIRPSANACRTTGRWVTSLAATWTRWRHDPAGRSFWAASHEPADIPNRRSQTARRSSSASTTAASASRRRRSCSKRRRRPHNSSSEAAKASNIRASIPNGRDSMLRNAPDLRRFRTPRAHLRTRSTAGAFLELVRVPATEALARHVLSSAAVGLVVEALDLRAQGVGLGLYRAAPCL